MNDNIVKHGCNNIKSIGGKMIGGNTEPTEYPPSHLFQACRRTYGVHKSRKKMWKALSKASVRFVCSGILLKHDVLRERGTALYVNIKG